MENLERKFDKVLSLQILDKSKAITHILQEVRLLWLDNRCLKLLTWMSQEKPAYNDDVTTVMSSGCTVQEEMQKAAFQALQLQKDAVHGYIRNQVCVDDRVKAILHLWLAVT